MTPEHDKDLSTPIAATTVAVRVRDPFGLLVVHEDGRQQQCERDTVVNVSPAIAEQLFKEGKVSLEEMRPVGAPAHVEKR